MKKKKINGWDDAITQANATILYLRKLIATCNEDKASGQPFPLNGSWGKAIFEATCHVAKLEETISAYRNSKTAGHPWPGYVSAVIN